MKTLSSLVCATRVFFIFIYFLFIGINHSVGQEKSVLYKAIAEQSEFAEIDMQRAFKANAQFKNIVSDCRVFSLDFSNANKRSKKSKAISLTVPSPIGDLKLNLIESSIAANGYELITSSGERTTVFPDDIHYRGIIDGEENSFVTVSLYENDLHVIASLPNKGNFILKKLKNSTDYVSYFEKDLLIAKEHDCHTPDETGIVPAPSRNELMNSERRVAGECVKVHLEAEYDLFVMNGSSVINTINELESIFNVVIALYANESIDVSLGSIKVWDTADNFNETSANSALDDFSAYVVNANIPEANLYHLISGTSNNNGGLAYIDVLCNSNKNSRTAYSNIYGSHSTLPTFSWDVEVVTHEMGHNMGSNHTHACVWNGNNTQLDDCGNIVANNGGQTPEGNACFNAASPIAPTGGPDEGMGTIMSYCHLFGQPGISFNNGFGVQPGNLIRNRYNNANCTYECPNPDCEQPKNLLVNNVTDQTATISWIDGGSSTNYIAKYTPNGGSTVAQSTTATSWALTGLSPETLYSVEVYAECAGGEESLISTTSFRTTCSSQITNFPYSESFESDNGGWTSGGTNNSWALGNPQKTNITGASDGNKAWVTGGLSTGFYSNNEASYVESPCFDFSAISNTQLSVDIWWYSEADWDGTVFQYSTNGGLYWTTVGAFGDGNNWYDNYDIYSQPGGSIEGWSNNVMTDWVTATHDISFVDGLDNVNFRFVFGSDGYVQDDGFAFDNIMITGLGATCYDLTTTNYSCNIADTGSVTTTYAATAGCDSIVTTITTLASNYYFDYQSYSCNVADTGTTIDTFYTTNYGCDSIVVDRILLAPSYNINLHESTCTIEDTGTVVESLKSVYDCDSVITTRTSFEPSYNIHWYEISCNPIDTGQNSTIHTSSNGCDSTVIIHTSLAPTYDILQMTYSCNPNDTGTTINHLKTIYDCDSIITTKTLLQDSYDIQFSSYSCAIGDTGKIVQSLKTINDCDSIITHIVLLAPSYDILIEKSSCSVGDTGTVIAYHTSAKGCDSTITTRTELVSSYVIDLFEISCQIEDTGLVVQSYTSSNGCDSTVNTRTDLAQSYEFNYSEWSCDPNDTGSVTINLQTIHGCDSVITTVVQLAPSYDIINLSYSCFPEDTGRNIQFFQTVKNCDSTISTIVELLPSYNISLQKTSCNAEDEGISIDSSLTIAGCDSITTTTTTHVESYLVELYDYSCDSRDTGKITTNYVSTAGCDSTVILTTYLSVSYDLQEVLPTCDSNLEGTVINVFQTTHGCDSIIETTYLLLPSYNIVNKSSTCDSSITGTTVESLQTIKGCDSIITTSIELLPSYNLTITDTTCRSTESGREVRAMNTAQGCDSIVTIEYVFIDTVIADFEYEMIGALSVSFDNNSENEHTWTWDFGDGNGFSTIENPDYTYEEPGIYTVDLQVEGECGIAVTSKTINLMSTHQYEYINESIGLISIYPNPVTDLLYLSFDNQLNNNSEIVLMDIAGQKLSTYTIQKFETYRTIDLSNLPQGTYMLSITNGTENYITKLIKL